MFRTLVSLTVLCVLVAAATPRSYGQKPQASPKDEEAKLIAVLKSDAPAESEGRRLPRAGSGWHPGIGGPTGGPALQ